MVRLRGRSAPTREPTPCARPFLRRSDLGPGYGLAGLATEPAWAASAFLLTALGIAVVPWVYLAFLGHALDVRITRPFRTRAAAVVLAVAAAVAAATVLVAPGRYLLRVVPDPGEGAEFDFVQGPWAAYEWVPFAFVAAYGLVASIVAFVGTRPGTLARRRTGAFVAAFGIRDGWLVLATFVLYPLIFGIGSGSDPGLDPTIRTAFQDRAATIVFYGGNLVAFTLYFGVVAYGMVRSQLLDVDVKIRWTVQQSTIAAAFIAVFFIAAQLAQNYLTESLGWAVGGIMAGLLLFAIAPIQRIAERVAHVAVPDAKATREMTEDERADVYLEAARLAWADGAMSRDERALLDGLRAKLGLSPDATARLET
ncbi:MAG: hypothetical protein ACT4PT_11435, partial [Methanobacteriota archaeon]